MGGFVYVNHFPPIRVREACPRGEATAPSATRAGLPRLSEP
jgi:hypothetical protein